MQSLRLYNTLPPVYYLIAPDGHVDIVTIYFIGCREAAGIAPAVLADRVAELKKVGGEDPVRIDLVRSLVEIQPDADMGHEDGFFLVLA